MIDLFPGRHPENLVTLQDVDRTAIAAIVARQCASWQASDATGFAADAQEGIVFTNVVGMFSIGRAPFIAQHAHIFATIYQGSKMAQEIVAVTLVRPDVAIVDTLTELTDTRHRPPGIELIDGAVRTRLEQVMVKDGCDWQVASFHNVAIHPAVAGGAPPST